MSISTTKFDAQEQQFRAFLNNAAQVQKTFGELDMNGNKKLSLAEIDKWVVERFPLLNNKKALMRAYKQTTANEGDGDAYVNSKEFVSLLTNIIFFNRLYVVFSQIDADADARIDFKEFSLGFKWMGLKYTEVEAKAEFKKMDSNAGGKVLFEEFTSWVAKKARSVGGVSAAGKSGVAAAAPKRPASARPASARPGAAPSAPAAAAAPVSTTKFDATEKKFRDLLKDDAALKKTFSDLDNNASGRLSLAEIDKWIVFYYPVLNNKKALMRAFQMVVGEDQFVGVDDFKALLSNVIFFNRLMLHFASMDTDQDMKVNFKEFCAGCSWMNLRLSEKDCKTEFVAMDANKGGVVMFDEFCAWIAKKHIQLNGTLAVAGGSKKPGSQPSSRAASPRKSSASGPATVGINVSKFDAVEKKYRGIIDSEKELKDTYLLLDMNRNEKLSLAEIDKFVVERYPLLNNKRALMRAYKQTTEGEAVLEDAYVQMSEFKSLLINLIYFSRVYYVFDAADTDDDHRITLNEMKKGCSLMGLRMSDREVQQEFEKMDANGGGLVLFDEFCDW